MSRQISPTRAVALLGGPEGDWAGERPAYRGLARALRMLVADGRIPPGTRLPSERELTVALGVSRTTVTRAYADLKESGHLVARQGSGSVTARPQRPGAADALLSPAGGPADSTNLTVAAPSAPPGVLAAYAAALTELPAHLDQVGYYPTGLPALREALAARFTARGLPTSPDQILVTAGALAGLAVVARALIRPGVRVLTESPTYPNAVAALRASGARVVGADIGQHGWAASSLVDAVTQERPGIAYLMPDFHNPTGQLMDDHQRDRVAGALRRTGTVAIIDETMAELAIDETAPVRPFAAHAPNAFTVGSASKTFWGGLRLGWIRAPESGVDALVAARLSLDLGAPVVDQLALAHLLGDLDAVLSGRREQLRAARSALVAALAEHLPGWRFTVPPGGLSLWCELPRAGSTLLAEEAARAGIMLAPGPVFAPEGGLDRFVRLPFTQPPDVLRDAVARLGAVWAATEERDGRSRRRTISVRRGAESPLAALRAT